MLIDDPNSASGKRVVVDVPQWPESALSLIEEQRVIIGRLTDAIWEYGQHRPSCRIDSGKECDCGFFDIIKSLKE